MKITEYSVEPIKDPFGILEGARYEFIIIIDVDEDDELYSDNGLYVRAIYSVAGNKSGLVKYELHERGTDAYLDFDLEDDEVDILEAFCKEHLDTEAE
ncbi:DUF6509 family protein [Paenibacillus protaetiae]|uniref:Pullulanase n=1 Tax=Paenibacillus protaetiae TaxID=2509456 RepID=A0A4P6ESQ9_9BACL|nr:DUF6509 family protein [Paenibacillus protaetiae]QAY65972.1 pullulanase [Paenibacillus protaetiae]